MTSTFFQLAGITVRDPIEAALFGAVIVLVSAMPVLFSRRQMLGRVLDGPPRGHDKEAST